LLCSPTRPALGPPLLVPAAPAVAAAPAPFSRSWMELDTCSTGAAAASSIPCASQLPPCPAARSGPGCRSQGCSGCNRRCPGAHAHACMPCAQARGGRATAVLSLPSSMHTCRSPLMCSWISVCSCPGVRSNPSARWCFKVCQRCRLCAAGMRCGAHPLCPPPPAVVARGGEAVRLQLMTAPPLTLPPCCRQAWAQPPRPALPPWGSSSRAATQQVRVHACVCVCVLVCVLLSMHPGWSNLPHRLCCSAPGPGHLLPARAPSAVCTHRAPRRPLSWLCAAVA